MKPGDADIHNLRGNVYYKNGQINEAIADYSRAIEINPGLANVYNNRGGAYIIAGKIEMASEDYKKALELNPRYGETNDGREIVCRRGRPITGSILSKEYCATKSYWDAGVIEHEIVPGVANIIRDYPGDSLIEKF